MGYCLNMQAEFIYQPFTAEIRNIGLLHTVARISNESKMMETYMNLNILGEMLEIEVRFEDLREKRYDYFRGHFLHIL